MIRHKLFTSLQEEEHWINSIQSEGYQLVQSNSVDSNLSF